jgi:predicted PurR-regulated permease PerM
MNEYKGDNIVQGVPDWLRRVGVQSWLFIGVVLAAIVVFSLMGALNQIVNSLVVSLLLAILSRPLVDWLERHKVSRNLGSILTIILILLGLIGLVVITARGVTQQGSEIAAQIQD